MGARQVSHDALYNKQHSAYAWVVTCILFLINLTFHNLSLHSSYKLHQPFTDYFLRLPYSELLEKRVFRSRANRRLVVIIIMQGATGGSVATEDTPRDPCKRTCIILGLIV